MSNTHKNAHTVAEIQRVIDELWGKIGLRIPSDFDWYFSMGPGSLKVTFFHVSCEVSGHHGDDVEGKDLAELIEKLNAVDFGEQREAAKLGDASHARA